jgi:hypothetical protein
MQGSCPIAAFLKSREFLLVAAFLAGTGGFVTWAALSHPDGGEALSPAGGMSVSGACPATGGSQGGISCQKMHEQLHIEASRLEGRSPADARAVCPATLSGSAVPAAAPGAPSIE